MPEDISPNGKIKEGAYDLVLCSMVIHHLEDRVGALKMFKSMLKTNGHFGPIKILSWLMQSIRFSRYLRVRRFEEG